MGDLQMGGLGWLVRTFSVLGHFFIAGIGVLFIAGEIGRHGELQLVQVGSPERKEEGIPLVA
jgi:hypothetical protein